MPRPARTPRTRMVVVDSTMDTENKLWRSKDSQLRHNQGCIENTCGPMDRVWLTKLGETQLSCSNANPTRRAVCQFMFSACKTGHAVPNKQSAKGWRMGRIGGSSHLDTAATRDCSHPELCWPRLRWRAQWTSQVASMICGQTVHWNAPNCTDLGTLVKIQGRYAWEPPNGPQRKVSGV